MSTHAIRSKRANHAARAPRSRICSRESYEARLARIILAGGDHGRAAAVTLLEHRDPATLHDAASLLADQSRVTADAFDLLADAWESYQHIKNLSTD